MQHRLSAEWECAVSTGAAAAGTGLEALMARRMVQAAEAAALAAAARRAIRNQVSYIDLKLLCWLTICAGCLKCALFQLGLFRFLPGVGPSRPSVVLF